MSNDMMASMRGESPMSLSPWQMFLAADVVVQTVMVLLLLAGLATWIIWAVKLLELRTARREVAAALAAAQSAGPLSALVGRDDVLGVLSATAVQEQQAASGARDAGVQQRAAASLARVEAALARRINRGTGVLATVGSTAPFVGLFGTVWGIMNSFIGIAQTQTTNLAVVAPGIAEALLATAMGLFAAIPAVILYNALGRAGADYCAQVADVITQVLNQLDRELQPRS